ncbi:hypothetical protein F4W70_17665 [Pseudomonas cannabina]|nr:hypothetical protein F4W70_17665 [Pseudomonas cannabina]
MLDYRADAPRCMQFWTLCVLFVALRVTQRFCEVSWIYLRPDFALTLVRGSHSVSSAPTR